MGVQRDRLKCLIRKSCVSILDGNLISSLSAGRSDPPGPHNQIWQHLPSYLFEGGKHLYRIKTVLGPWFFFSGCFSLSYCRLKPKKYPSFSFNSMFAVSLMLKIKIEIGLSLKMWGQRKQKSKMDKPRRDLREHRCRNKGKTHTAQHSSHGKHWCKGFYTRILTDPFHSRGESHSTVKWPKVAWPGFETGRLGLLNQALGHSTPSTFLPPHCYMWENPGPERRQDFPKVNQLPLELCSLFQLIQNSSLTAQSLCF